MAGLPDDDEVRVLAFGAHLGERLDQVRQALERHVGTRGRHQSTGHARDMGERAKLLLVDADRHDVQRVGVHAHLRDDVLLRVLRHRDVARQLAGDVHLHAQESVPAAECQPAIERRRVRQLQVTVDGDRMVQRVHERPAVANETQQPPPEALVVVDEVELVAAVAQLLVDAATERVRLGEPGGPP